MAINGAPLFAKVVTLSIDDKLWSQLRVAYSVKKTSRSKPNTAEITVTGLASATRLQMLQRGLPVRLVAGYAGSAGEIFRGELDSAEVTRDGTDWNLTIHASDGRTAWRKYANRSWRAGEPWQNVVKYLAEQMGLAVPPSALGAITGSVRGRQAVCGLAWREMDVIMATLGLQWSIQDGAVQVVQADKSLKTQVIVVTPQSGLIGVPRYTDPKISRVGKQRVLRRRPAIEFEALTLPDFQCGRPVRLESQIITGDYRIDSVSHDGDSHGGGQLVTTIAASEITTGAA